MTTDTRDADLKGVGIALLAGNNLLRPHPLGGSTRDSGGIMTMFVIAAVGFVGMAIALLNDGSDIDFRNRQLAGAYRHRWA